MKTKRKNVYGEFVLMGGVGFAMKTGQLCVSLMQEGVDTSYEVIETCWGL